MSSNSRTQYFSCSIKGCTKIFRAVTNFYPPQNGLGFYLFFLDGTHRIKSTQPFAPVHTMMTKCWTDAYRWRKDASNRVRIRAADNIYAVVRRHVGGHLNDARASSLIDKFLNFSFLTYDEYTHLTNNVCILREDESRPELYNCTCMANAKEFMCKHSV